MKKNNMIKSTKKKETMKKTNVEMTKLTNQDKVKFKPKFIMDLASTQLTTVTDRLLKFYNAPMMTVMPKRRLIELEDIIKSLVMLEETLKGNLVFPKDPLEDIEIQDIKSNN